MCTRKSVAGLASEPQERGKSQAEPATVDGGRLAHGAGAGGMTGLAAGNVVGGAAGGTLRP